MKHPLPYFTLVSSVASSLPFLILFFPITFLVPHHTISFCLLLLFPETEGLDILHLGFQLH